MDDTWLTIEDDLSECASDSDIIDSETEADLYSAIHHQENISSHISKSVQIENDAVHDSSPAVLTSPVNNAIIKQEKQQTEFLEKKQSTPNENAWLSKFRRDSNPTKKFKFAGDSDNFKLGFNESCKQTSVKDIQTFSRSISNNKQSPKKKNGGTKVEPSDSEDSIIWTELDSFESSDFTTNLSKEDADMIYISSSDSDSEFPTISSSTFTKKESVLRNLSLPNIKIGEKHEGKWYLNHEDLYRSRHCARRYHNELKCTNCNKRGHNVKSCPEAKVLKCFICGGRHLGSKCTNRICGNCFQYGHERRRCRLGPNFFFCELCSRHGHVTQTCPDLWRRYHLTTESVQIVPGKQVKQDSNIYCWNCGQNGHFGSDCQNGFSRNSFNTWPSVISYDDPREMFRGSADLRMRQNNFGWNERFQHQESLNQALMQRQQMKAAQKKQKRKRKAEKMKNNLGNIQPQATNKNTPKTCKIANKIIESCKRKIENSKRKIIDAKKQINTLVRAKDFPRSPKNIIPNQPDEIPRSVEVIRKKQLRKQRQRLRRQIKRKNRLIGKIANQKSAQLE